MTKTVLKKKISECVNRIDDNKILEAVYIILNGHITSNDITLSQQDLGVINERKKAILKGKEKIYTVAEVKKKLLKNLGK